MQLGVTCNFDIDVLFPTWHTKHVQYEQMENLQCKYTNYKGERRNNGERKRKIGSMSLEKP